MSEPKSTITSTISRDEWDAVLRQLRTDGFSPIESIKVTRAVLHVNLADAKAIVHNSRTWSDLRPGFDALHDSVEAAANRL